MDGEAGGGQAALHLSKKAPGPGSSRSIDFDAAPHEEAALEKAHLSITMHHMEDGEQEEGPHACPATPVTSPLSPPPLTQLPP